MSMTKRYMESLWKTKEERINEIRNNINYAQVAFSSKDELSEQTRKAAQASLDEALVNLKHLEQEINIYDYPDYPYAA